MKLIEYLKGKNVLSIDVWVFIALMILIPKTNIEYDLSSNAVIPSVILSVLYIIFITILLFTCSRLRGYRYLDVYMQCKKPTSALWQPLLYIGIAMMILSIFWMNITFYNILSALTTVGLSIHFNNTTELKQEAA